MLNVAEAAFYIKRRRLNVQQPKIPNEISDPKCHLRSGSSQDNSRIQYGLVVKSYSTTMGMVNASTRQSELMSRMAFHHFMAIPHFSVDMRLVDDLITHWILLDKFVIGDKVLQSTVREVGLIIGLPDQGKTVDVETQQRRSKRNKKGKGLERSESSSSVSFVENEDNNNVGKNEIYRTDLGNWLIAFKGNGTLEDDMIFVHLWIRYL